MSKKLVSRIVVLFLCFFVSGLIYQPAKAESQKVTVTTDKSAATVTVTIVDAALDGKEVSVVCYNPQWTGSFTDWSANKNCIVYLSQIKVNGTTSFSFPLNSQVLSGNYSLVTGSGNGRVVTPFNFDSKSSVAPTPTNNAVVNQLAAPSSVKAVQSDAEKAKVTWKGVTGATTYSVYRSNKANDGYTKLGDTASLLYTDKKASAGKTYYYKVTSNGSTAAQTSVMSTAAKVTIMKAPVIKVKSSKKKAVVSWKKISGVKGYKVYVATKKNGKYKAKLTIKGAAKLKGTIKKLKSGKTYYFKVKAYKKVNGKTVLGKFSKVKSVKVK